MTTAINVFPIASDWFNFTSHTFRGVEPTLSETIIRNLLLGNFPTRMEPISVSSGRIYTNPERVDIIAAKLNDLTLPESFRVDRSHDQPILIAQISPVKSTRFIRSLEKSHDKIDALIKEFKSHLN